MALPAVIVFIAVELQEHWDGQGRWLYITCIALALTTWLGTLAKRDWARRIGGEVIDAVIFLFLISCLLLSLGFGDIAAMQSAGRLLFWSPLVCLWWAYQHRESFPRLITSEAALFGSLAVLHLGTPGLLVEYIFLAAMITSLAWHATPSFSLAIGQPNMAGATKLSQLDAVTSLPSPERFEDELALTVAVADRYRIPFSLLICEIKGLDGYAGDHGIPAVNEILKRFAWKISDQLRIADTLCRWEGGKFIILLPNTDVSSSQKLVDRIRHASESIFYPGGSPITVHIGICQHVYGDDPMITFSLAEAAMFADASASGK